MRRDNVNLVIAAGTAVAAALVQLLPQSNPVVTVLRVLTGVPLALLLPGYALSRLLLPRPGGGMSWVRQALWSVGLSLVVTVLGGLLLNLTPAGLNRVSWTILLVAVTLLATGAAALDRRPAARRRPWRFSVRSAAYGVGALGAVAVAVWLAYSGAAGQAQGDFAQLWLVPANANTATLGVRNERAGTERFTVNLTNGTQPVQGWEITLAAGQTWQQNVPAGQPLTATLTQPDRTTQTVTLTTATPPKPSR